MYFLSFLGLFLNYFTNLGKNINVLILVIFLTYLIISQNKFLLKKNFYILCNYSIGL